MYLQKSRTCLNRNNSNEFNRELYFSSFVVCETLSLKGQKKSFITNFTKICTNYVIDWEEIIKADYKPYARYKANPYGMVMIVPTPQYENRPETYIYELYPIAKNEGLWEKIDRRYTKEIHMLTESGEIKEALTKGETFKGECIKEFDDKEISDAETLSMVYQHFEPEELNILCSHRDVNKSRDCMEYAFRCWSTNFSTVIRSLDNNSPGDRIMKSISDIARSCEQLEVKTGFILEGMPTVIGKIEDEVIPAVAGDRGAKAVLNMLYKRLVDEDRAPHLNVDYIAVLNGQYRLNRGEIYPLNKALIGYFENSYHGRDNTLQSFGIRETMNKNIKSMNQKLKEDSKIDSEIYQKEIEPNLKEIKKVYDELCRRVYPLLKPFLQKGRWGEKINWEVGDGRGESWGFE